MIIPECPTQPQTYYIVLKDFKHYASYKQYFFIALVAYSCIYIQVYIFVLYLFAELYDIN